MKRACYFLMLLPHLLFGQYSSVQEKPAFVHELKINYTYLGTGIIQLQYEKMNQPNRSINCYLSYIDFLFQGNLVGFHGAFGVKNYFTPEKPNSFYIEPSVGFLYLEDRYYYEKYTTPSLALVLGRKAVIAKRVSLEFYLGPSLNFGFIKNGTQSSQKLKDWFGPINGIFMRTGLTMGYKFN